MGELFKMAEATASSDLTLIDHLLRAQDENDDQTHIQTLSKTTRKKTSNPMKKVKKSQYWMLPRYANFASRQKLGTQDFATRSRPPSKVTKVRAFHAICEAGYPTYMTTVKKRKRNIASILNPSNLERIK